MVRWAEVCPDCGSTDISPLGEVLGVCDSCGAYVDLDEAEHVEKIRRRPHGDEDGE